jgi:hypothetical protein
VVLLAFMLGVASDAIGPAGRINILAPPLLAVLAWNLAVYLALVLRTGGAVRRLAQRLDDFVGRRARDARPALARFAADWAAASGSLQGARIALVLHAGAAALVAGALASLYLRGIAYEYRAGWDSTFLTPDAVHRLLALVLGPAAHLSGIALPGVDRLAQLRFSAGNGENAAPWIHLYALTLGLAIVLPRVVLAAVATARAHALALRFPLALDDDYFERLRRAFSGEPVAVLVLPYSYQVPAETRAALGAALQRRLGPNVALTLAEPLPQGAEDDLAPWLDATTGRVVVALFPLAATPERETHGAFVRALAAHPAVARLLACVDESDFRRRFTGTEGARRLEERRGAWSRALADAGIEPLFVDLAAGARA